jgi:DNA-directed RNA polymerase subunit M/transcription elongation factor TFIIS
MEQQIGGRTCPECGSDDYQFRGRRKVAEAVETKYRCKACGHKWRVMAVGSESPPPSPRS